MRILLFILAGWLLSPAVDAAELAGKPTVIDGQSLKLVGTVVRLYGIRAPALAEDCPFQGRIIPCGRISRTALMDLTAGATVRCRLRPERRDGTAVAVCRAGGYDLSEGMTYTGWAQADTEITDQYLRYERQARKQGHGLWRRRAEVAGKPTR